MMKATGNRARSSSTVCGFHNRDTTKGEELFRVYGLDGSEVTDDVFESPAGRLHQAENRMHTIKALLVAPLA